MVQLEATLDVDVWYRVHTDREKNESAQAQTRETYSYTREFVDHPDVDAYLPSVADDAPYQILERANLPEADFDEEVDDYEVVEHEVTLYGNTSEWETLAEAMAPERGKDVVEMLRELAKYEEVSGAERAADELEHR